LAKLLSFFLQEKRKKLGQSRAATCGHLPSARWYFSVSRKKYATQRNVPHRAATHRNSAQRKMLHAAEN